MKKTKVLFFIYQMGGGGAARTLLNIINHLDRDKFTPMLVTLNFQGNYEAELRSDVKFIKLNTKRLRGAVFPLARIIRREGIDIVFSTIPNVNTIAILARMISRTGAKNVIREADNLGGSFLANLKLRCFGLIYRFSEQIISLSAGVQENLVKRYGIKPNDIKVIYNPVDLSAIQDKIEHGAIDPEHRPLFATQEKVIITAGRLVEQKDQRTLLRAFSKVNQHIKSRLIILGEGPLKDDLLRQAHDLNIADRVHLIGFQSNPYIYFKQADLFVLSSKHEGFSHVLAEALATGTPVVSTNCKSGPAEVLQQGKYGLLCAVGDTEGMTEKMLRILTLDAGQATEVIRKGYQRAQDFSAQEIVRQYEEVFVETNIPNVVHMTTVHHPLDTRIYHKECQSLQKAGYRVTLIAPESGDGRPEDAGSASKEAGPENERSPGAGHQDKVYIIPFKKQRNRFLRMLFSTFRVYLKARQLRADYYHIHDPELLPAAWLLKKKNNVVIYDIHEDYETSIMLKEYIPKSIRRMIASLYNGVEGFLSRKLELCLAEKYYKDKYPRGKCILNYPVLNRTLIDHWPQARVEEGQRDEGNEEVDGSPDDQATEDDQAPSKLIYTGNVSLERGAEIHAALPLLDPHISVYFVGRCPRELAGRMYAIAGERKNQLMIEGIGRYVPRETIDEWYGSQDWLAGLALFPPSDHYMQKELTKFFEYMSAGIPIICSDFPVWKNFVEKYACGLTVNPYDTVDIKLAIDYLRIHPDKAREMGENGRKAVLEHLNWQTQEKKLIQWYDEMGTRI